LLIHINGENSLNGEINLSSWLYSVNWLLRSGFNYSQVNRMLNLFRLKSALPRLVRRLVRSRRGVTAIALLVLLGFAGLAIDVDDWLATTRNAQSTVLAGTAAVFGNDRAREPVVTVAISRTVSDRLCGQRPAD
jgi:hypothetical protein